MIAISLKFIAGRYHATPWGRHVNEGTVEWPPSPWRILRAMVAVWKRTLPELQQSAVEPILRYLAEPPEFVLPPASTGHTRHFMPWFKKGADDRTLVFDTFVAVSREALLWARWPEPTLDNLQIDTLSRILGNLNTFGRSESWCEAELVGNAENFHGLSCRPRLGDAPAGYEIIRLLCADPARAFADDRVVTATMKTEAQRKTKDPLKKRSAIYDPAWNLCTETLQLHRERWSDPPGSRWVPYVRPRDCFKVERKPPHRATSQRPIQVIRFALDSTVLPLVTETLAVAEAGRRALMGIYGRLTETNGVRGRSKVFSGKDEHDEPLADHTHAYYLPSDEDGDGRLDHLTVFASAGFGSDERRAFDRLREIRTGREGEERHPLRVVLLGMGASADYIPGPLQYSQQWVSATPYIATRYAKTRGRHRVDLGWPEQRENFLRDNLHTQLAGLWPELFGEQAPEVVIEPEWGPKHVFQIARRWRCIEFRRFRSKLGDDGGRRLSGAFRLTFGRAVQGPIALGYSSHFGMGLFMPLNDAARCGIHTT